MALLDSKQLNPKLTGSFILSGSTQTFIGASVFSGSADITGSVNVSGNISGSITSTGSFGYLNVEGDSVIAGNLTFGDADSDSVSFGADISSSLIPDVSNAYNIGSDGKRWNDFYLSGSVSATGGPHSIISATTIDLDAEGALTLDGGSITIGGDTDVAVDLDSSTLDIDASGALTIDSATSISIGTTADKPIDIDSTTLDIDASGAITIDGTSTILISGDGGATFSDDTEALVYDGSGNVDFDTVALDIDSSGAITIDGTSTLSIAGASTSTYGDDTAVWSFNGSGAVSETGMTTFSLTPSSTLDIDAGGAVTIDGTSITIGGDDSGVAVSIGHSTSETTIGDNLTVTGNITGSSNLEIAGNVSSSATSTGSFSRLEAVGNSNLIGHLTIGSDLVAPNTATASFGLINSTTHIATTVESATFACFTLISGSAVSTGSFGRVVVDNGISDNFIIDDGKVSGSFTTTGSFGRLEIGGNANIGGDITLGGDITIGDAAGDSVSFGAEISSSLVPDADSTYDIGSSSKNWRFGYIEQLSATHITGSGNISGSHTSTGSFGNVNVDELSISSLSEYSSSIATQLNTLTADVIALSIALG